jgi:capsular polysaccharide transport system ATP-binding protein
MIALRGVWLNIGAAGRRGVLRDCDFRFEDPRMLVLAADPTVRSAVIGLLAGHLPAQKGAVRRAGLTSWAIGALGPFRAALSGRDTIGFVCGLYGLRRRAAFELADALLDPAVDLERPVMAWPAAHQIQLGLTLALAPDFDIYLVDGAVRLADRAFEARWRPLFEARVADRQLVVATAQTAHAPAVADVGALVEDQRLRRVTDVRDRLRAFAAAPIVETPEAEPAAEEEEDLL